MVSSTVDGGSERTWTEASRHSLVGYATTFCRRRDARLHLGLMGRDRVDRIPLSTARASPYSERYTAVTFRHRETTRGQPLRAHNLRARSSVYRPAWITLAWIHSRRRSASRLPARSCSVALHSSPLHAERPSAPHAAHAHATHTHTHWEHTAHTRQRLTHASSGGPVGGRGGMRKREYSAEVADCDGPVKAAPPPLLTLVAAARPDPWPDLAGRR